MALGTPTDGGAAYSAQNGTSVSPAYPTGIQAGDCLVLIVGMKPSTANGGTIGSSGAITGWTQREALTGAGGYGTTLGADTGNTNLWIYTKDTVDGTETGNLSVTVGTNNVSWGLIVRIPSGAGSFVYGTADGSRTTAPTSGTAFTTALTNGTAAPNLQDGDMAIWAMCIPTDVLNNGFTAPTISSTGTTFGTAVELEEPDSGNGNDIGGYVAYAEATAGSSTAAPTVGVTATGTVTNVRGPIALIRIRENVQTLTPSLYTNSQTFYAATVSVGAVTLSPALYTNEQTFYSAEVTQAGGAQDLAPGLYENAQTFYSATVAASYTLQPALYENAQTFYAPTLSTSVTLTPSLYSNAQTFYAAVVAQDGGPQTLVPDLYENTSVFYGATLASSATLASQTYENAQTFYGPTITTVRTLSASLYTNNQTFYAPTVSNGGATTQDITFPDYVESGYVEGGYVAWTAFNNNQFFPAEITRRYHEIEIVDFEPKVWWLRKPKTLSEDEAKDKVQEVARTIVRVAKAKPGENLKKEVKKAVAPLVRAMPGFDWVALYEQVLLQIRLKELEDEQAQQQAQALQAWQAQQAFLAQLDEEDALILLMA